MKYTIIGLHEKVQHRSNINEICSNENSSPH